MDKFDKLYKQSKITRRGNPTAKSTWFKNASKSIGNSALDVVSSFMPSTMDTAVSLRDTQKELRQNIGSVKKATSVKTSDILSAGKEIWNNSLDDLRSGNIYNKERIKADADKASGLDFNFEDFDFGENDSDFGGDFDFDMTSDDGLSSVKMSRKTGKSNEITQINIDTNLGEDSALVQATNRQTQISVKATQQLAETSTENTKAVLLSLSKVGKTLTGQLASINDNVGTIATVVSESLTAHINIASKYYEDSMSLFQSINDTLVSMNERMLATATSSRSTERDVSDYNSVLDLFNGNGFDANAYFNLVKKQAKSTFDSSIFGMLYSFSKMSGMGENKWKSSPISTAITEGIKMVIPGAMKTAMEQFDNQLKETIATGLVKLRHAGGFSNPLMDTIGKIFGISNTKYTVDKSNYNKGPMQWNGIAHRTLVDVIPTYLSQIAAAVTGTEQKVFDYKAGKYRSLKTIRDNYNEDEKRETLSPYSDIKWEFRRFVDKFKLSSESAEDYKNKFDKYLLDIVKKDGGMDFKNTQQVIDSVGDETVAKMIQQFMRVAPKQMVTAAFGSNVLQANENISRRNKQIEEDPTKYNYQYIKNGMATISPNGKNGLMGSRVDEFSHDNLYYLRKILQTINTSVPVRITKGGAEFNKGILSELGTMSGTVRDVTSESSKGTRASFPSLSSGDLELSALDLSPEELKELTKDKDLFAGNKTPGILKFMKKLKISEDTGIYKLVSNVVNIREKAGEKGTSVLNSMTDALFNILFGDEDQRGAKGIMNLFIGGIKKQVHKFGVFIDDKMIKPLNESLFGEKGLITQISESETLKKLKSRLDSGKKKATDFLFGEKGTDGKRKGGIFSETMNSLTDMGTTAKDFILHDEDGIVGSMKGMYRAVTESVKKSLGIETDKDAPKVPLSEKISSGASDFLTHIKSRGNEWVDLIFGKKEEDSKLDEAKASIVSGFDVFKSDMKGKKGKLGASTVLGVLGSFFLPGGPVAGALLGLSTGIISESSQLKDFLFGDLGENGERKNNGIISKEFQKFFKDNKTGMSIGAFAGAAGSIGLLPSFFIPGGPIGGALIGGAISLANKAGAFNDILYGDGGSEDNITGGITKFIKDHYNKNANIKSTFMDAGIGAGVGIIGSFFLPGGPITGALLGSATSIAVNTDKFKTLMFGEEVLDENGNSTGKRKGGLLGKFTNYIGDKVLLPLSKAGKIAQVKILGFVEKNMKNPFKAAMKPFTLAGKNFIDGVNDTINDLKQSFREKITKPIGDAVETHILNPMKTAFKKIFGGLGRIVGAVISAPFKMLLGTAKSLNKDQVKSGQSNYDMDAELEHLNEMTDKKQTIRLRMAERQNSKRKRWVNPLSRGTAEVDTKSNEPAGSSTVINQPETSIENDANGNATISDTNLSLDKDNIILTPGKKVVRQRGNGTRASIPMNLQFFASGKDSTGDDEDYESSVLRMLESIDSNVTAIFNHIMGVTPANSSPADSNIPKDNSSSMEAYVRTISNSVDGQLNGVGYNVNKILRVLLKKNGLTDDDVAGENNKKYSKGRRVKDLLLSPFKGVKHVIDGALTTIKTTAISIKDSVVDVAKGIASLPKRLLKMGIDTVKGIGTAVSTTFKTAGKAIMGGLNAAGNAILSAANGFGEMIGHAATGFGEMIGGALGGIGEFLHGMGLVGKELAPVIAGGISKLIGVPFKLAGVAGGFISKLFGKGNSSGKGSSGSLFASHVIVDAYAGENRILTALKAIEHAVLYGTPMEMGSNVLSEIVPESGNGTRAAIPMNLQFFASKSKKPNFLSRVKSLGKNKKKDRETKVASGSATQIKERFAVADEKKEQRNFREKVISLFEKNNKEQKKQGIDWSAIFSKKGLITGALLLAIPLLIKLIPKLIGFIKNVGGKILDWVGDTGKDVIENAESQGGIAGIVKGTGEQVTSVTDLLGTTKRKEYAIGKNGEILTDENGNPIETEYDDKLGTRISEFYTPTTTKIDHDTGEAYQMQQYDALSRAKLNTTRQIAAKGIKTAKHATGIAKSAGKTIAKVGSKAAYVAATAAIHIDDLTKSSVATTAYDTISNIAKKPGKVASSAATGIKTAATGMVEKIINLGGKAFELLDSKFAELIKKYAPNSKGLSKLSEFIGKIAQKVFNVETVTKHMSKFSKLMKNIATAASTLMTSEIFWGVTGAVSGATNAAYTFEVDNDAVDWKMRLISGVFRALLSTSVGGFVDIADAIIYEISGTSFVNQLANLVYSLMSSDEDVEALKQAQDKFSEGYDTYVEEEYEAYKKNQEANGQAAMSLDEFKQSNLSTSRQEYNSEQNKSVFKKAWDTIKGAPHNIKSGVTKIKTGVKEKWDNSKLKTLVDNVMNFGSTVVSGIKGIIKHAWTGDDEDLVKLPAESDDPTVAVAKTALIGANVLLTPITGPIKLAKGIVTFVKKIWDGVKTVGSTVANSVTGRIEAAWKGELYEPVDFKDNPLGPIGTTLDISTGVLLSPITGVVGTVGGIARFAKSLWTGYKAIWTTIGSSAKERVKAAWNGTEYTSPDYSDNPLGPVAEVIDISTGAMLSPITGIVKGVSKIANVLKTLYEPLKDFGKSIISYVDVFDGNTKVSDYWKVPKDKDSSSGFGIVKTIMFYAIRSALAIPFYLTSAVTTLRDKLGSAVKGIANKVLNLFGDGSAFSTEDDGGSGGMGGFGGSTQTPKSSVNGFTYYSQNGTGIKDQSYNQTDGTPGTMGERGCGPTALSMVASELTGKDYDPVSMANIATANGYSTDVGTTTGYFGNVGSQLGMGVSSGRANPSSIAQSLQNGNPVILQGKGGSNSPYTSQGHYVVGVGMKDGKVLVNDPRGTQYSKAYSMDDVMDGAAGMWSFSGGKGLSTYDRTQVYSNSSEANKNKAGQALVNAMYSIKEKLSYSQGNDRDNVGDALTTGHGTGDCSSTVRWAYKQTTGIDPGSYTGAQINNSAGTNVDASTGGAPNEANLQPGDLLFYTKSGRGTHAAADVGHVEMYVGNGKLMGHGGGKDGKTPGPTEKNMATYRVADYIGAKRFVGDGTSVVNNFGGVTAPDGTSVAGSSTGSTASGSSTDSSENKSFSLSSLISGAIGAVSEGISNFFGMSSGKSAGSSSTRSTASGTSVTDSSAGNSSITAANVTAGDEQRQIWNYFTNQGLTKEGTAGLMGNLQQESGNHAVRLQGDYNPPYAKSQQYTQDVDNGNSNFVNDSKGYGLAQWTFSSRKQGLLDAAKANGKSVGDLGVQLAYLNHELNTKYGSVLNTLKTTNDIKTASDAVLHDFESPKDQSPTVENQRASYAKSYYDQFASGTQTSMNTYDRTQVASNAGGTGGFGSGSKTRPSVYQSGRKFQLGGKGLGTMAATTQSATQTPTTVPVYNSTPITKSTTATDIMNKLFEYLGKIVGYLESTSTGISQLNQKDFGGGSSYTGPTSYTNVNGNAPQSDQPDTSNYDLGRLIAQGQLT